MTQRLSALWERIWAGLSGIPEKKAFRVALAVWLIFGAVLATIVAVQPDRRTATLEYQWASAKWWKSTTIYQARNGYLYLPQWAMLYTPYELLPDRVGEPLWRLTMFAFLAWAVWKAAGKLTRDRQAAVFLIATVLLLPSSFASARNGQVNMPLGALYLLSAVMLSERRWIATAVLLTLSLALKPISMVPILLCAVLYPRTIIPLLVGIVVMLGAAFIHPNVGYVSEQYRIFWETLVRAGQPTKHYWCDFAGMLRTFGLLLPSSVHLLIRAGAAVVALWMAWRLSRVQDVFRAAYGVMLVAVIYLMLFNPRTEANSYIMLGTFIGVWGAYEGLIARRLCAAAWLAALAVVLGTENYGMLTFPWTNLWLKALCTLLLAAWLVIRLVRTPKGEAVLMRPAAV